MTSPSLAQRKVLAESGVAAAIPAIRLMASSRLRMTEELPFLLFLSAEEAETVTHDIPRAAHPRSALDVGHEQFQQNAAVLATRVARATRAGRVLVRQRQGARGLAVRFADKGGRRPR